MNTAILFSPWSALFPSLHPKPEQVEQPSQSIVKLTESSRSGYNVCIYICNTNTAQSAPHYLPSTTVTVQLLALLDRQAFTSGSSSSLSSSSSWFLPVLNAGSHGSGSVGVSLASIVVTADMVGLRFGCSCTHNNPICMHLSTSSAFDVSAIDGSMNSKLSPSLHSLHACRKWRWNFDHSLRSMSIATRNTLYFE